MEKYYHASALIAGARAILQMRVLGEDYQLHACRDMVSTAVELLDELRGEVEEAMIPEEDDPEVDDKLSLIVVHYKNGTKKTLLELKHEIERKHAEKTSP
jgi:hypothetical protein